MGQCVANILIIITESALNGRKRKLSDSGKDSKIVSKRRRINYSSDDVFEFFSGLLQKRFEEKNVQLSEVRLLTTVQKAWNDLPLSTMDQVVALFEKELRKRIINQESSTEPISKANDNKVVVKDAEKDDGRRKADVIESRRNEEEKTREKLKTGKCIVNLQATENGNQKKEEKNSGNLRTKELVNAIQEKTGKNVEKSTAAVGGAGKDTVAAGNNITKEQNKRNKVKAKRKGGYVKRDHSSQSSASSGCGGKNKNVNGKKAKDVVKRKQKEKPCPRTGGKCKCHERSLSSSGSEADHVQKVQKKRKIGARKTGRRRKNNKCSSNSSSGSDEIKRKNSTIQNKLRNKRANRVGCKSKPKVKRRASNGL